MSNQRKIAISLTMEQRADEVGLNWSTEVLRGGRLAHSFVTAVAPNGTYSIEWKTDDAYEIRFVKSPSAGGIPALLNICRNQTEARLLAERHFQRDLSRNHDKVALKIRPFHPRARIPIYATPLSSGFDLVACFGKETETVTLTPGDATLIPTGLSMEISPGYEVQIRSRSGLALKNGVVVLNSPGTIDADYRGEVGIILKNTSRFDTFTVTQGMKVAQGVLCPVVQANFIKIEEADATQTERGAGGFGSTGL